MAAVLKKVLVLGMGNPQLQDDGIGMHVTRSFKSEFGSRPWFNIIDTAEVDLSLLPSIEDADAVIVVAATETGKRPGSVQVLRNEQFDQVLTRTRKENQDVSLRDLFAAASIRGRCPSERVLIAVQPESVDQGDQPSKVVEKAIPRVCKAIDRISHTWLDD